MTLAITLVAVFTAIFAPLLYRIAQQRHVLQQEQFAIGHVGNVLDDLTVCPASELPHRIESWQADVPADRILPGAELTVSVSEPDAPEDGRAVTCRLRWRNRAGNWTPPVALTGWIYSEAETQP